MLKYSIMAFMVGFTGNKIFNQKDKTTKTSIKAGVIAAVILIVINVLILYL